jgi:hypothetical protein
MCAVTIAEKPAKINSNAQGLADREWSHTWFGGLPVIFEEDLTKAVIWGGEFCVETGTAIIAGKFPGRHSGGRGYLQAGVVSLGKIRWWERCRPIFDESDIMPVATGTTNHGRVVGIHSVDEVSVIVSDPVQFFPDREVTTGARVTGEVEFEFPPGDQDLFDPLEVFPVTRPSLQLVVQPLEMVEELFKPGHETFPSLLRPRERHEDCQIFLRAY